MEILNKAKEDKQCRNWNKGKNNNFMQPGKFSAKK